MGERHATSAETERATRRREMWKSGPQAAYKECLEYGSGYEKEGKWHQVDLARRVGEKSSSQISRYGADGNPLCPTNAKIKQFISIFDEETSCTLERIRRDKALRFKGEAEKILNLKDDLIFSPELTDDENIAETQIRGEFTQTEQPSLGSGPDTDARYRELMKRILKALRSSDALLDKLAVGLREGGLAPPPAGDKATRAEQIRNGLTSWPFLRVIDLLESCRAELDSDSDKDGVEAVIGVSRLLLPWLYIISPMAQARAGIVAVVSDRFVTLPAGLQCWAEIVRAGIELRAAAFREGLDDFPFGEAAFSPAAPGGIARSLEDSIREELFRIARPPAITADDDPPEKDVAINIQLEFIFKRKGLRPYVIVPRGRTFRDKPWIEEEVSNIAKLYPLLEIVRLHKRFSAEDQNMFNLVRDLLIYGQE